mmetsp:Transcript_4097/g.14958  ORF Transcript_4097/g.14958 Transcript_4097/m.14958 type:complete len:291 (-) Transcript_4097:1243-2115(-)
MIVANRRIEVVIRHEALAFGGDVVLAILDIRHVQAEFVVRIERRGRRPLNVHTNTRADARVLNFKPRRARSVRVRCRRVGKRLPIRRVIKCSRCHGGDLNSHAARPKRQETRQATHVKVCSVKGTATGNILNVLDVTERKRSINREFDVGLNRVYHSRLPARGDGVASAQLRQESSITIRTRGRKRTSRSGGNTLRLLKTLLVAPGVAHHALPVRAHLAVALREHGVILPVRRLQQRFGERVVEFGDVFRIQRRRRAIRADILDLNGFPVAVDLHAHPRPRRVRVRIPRR